MKALFKRGISVLCAAALAVCMVPSAALAESPDESFGGNAADVDFVLPAPDGEDAWGDGDDFGFGFGADEGFGIDGEGTLDTNPDAPLYGDCEDGDDPDAADSDAFEVICEIPLQTSVQQQNAIQLFSATESSVQLAPGNHERWIDRVIVPSYATTLYNVLEEAVDNDGVKDYLIDDMYYNGTAKSDSTFTRMSGVSALKVVSATGTVTEQQITESVAAVVAAFDRDHPEVFWMTGSLWLVTAEGSSMVYMLLSDGSRSMRNVSYPTEQAIERGITTRDAAAANILSDVPKGASQEAAVRYFNQWLTHNNEYNTSRYLDGELKPDPWECISALTGREGVNGPVCEGYARAFKVLCDYASVPCVLVDGVAVDPSSGTSEEHMWNYVRLAGKWYAVDATWNDPVAYYSGKVGGGENDAWLLVGGKSVIEGWEFLQSHPVENRVYPNGLCFTNGPVLSNDAFRAGTSTPAASISLPTVITSVKLSATSFTFNGKVQKPKLTVQAGTTSVYEGNYIAVFSGNCKSVGAYTVTVVGKGAYSGKVKATFKIKKPKPAAPVLSKAKSAKKGRLTATWKKASGKVTGYQVQYALNKKFTKSAKKVNLKLTSKLKKKSKLSKTVTKLKSKKTYYVRVRTYYKVGGKTFYSSWSKAKKIRVR